MSKTGSERPVYILIGHKSRQGKDSFAEMLKRKLNESTIVRFADPLKSIISDMLNISQETLEELKNNGNAKITDTEDELKGLSFRDILIRFGNGKMKSYFGDSVWSDLLYMKYDNSHYKYVIIPDFRFPIEYRDNAVTIKVYRGITQVKTNIADEALNLFDFQYVVKNHGTLQDLEDKANNIAKEIMELSNYD